MVNWTLHAGGGFVFGVLAGLGCLTAWIVWVAWLNERDNKVRC